MQDNKKSSIFLEHNILFRIFFLQGSHPLLLLNWLINILFWYTAKIKIKGILQTICVIKVYFLANSVIWN